MPDNQLNARFLTPEERLMAVERIRKNQQGVGNKHFKMYQLKEALADPMTWAFVFFALVADIPNASNVAGYTKKTTVGALYLIAYCVGNIIGPQTFRPKDKPRYVPAEITIIVCYALCVLDLGVIFWYYRKMNKKNEAVRANPGYKKLDKQEFLDLTDKENPEFVYTV
ncbi:putative Uncharacterized transporter [Glarea lozoyensis 74030]|uniref:Putative Uncharacterized transporter n=1 Tax=Glarea lozoyensis (strain ATCC 74030 / MF5533) TaxID=1104152 RepID=H0EU46_GLAL7|nr:putative Uncharacterized transporter [Glarea lozoyensis 74030]